MLKKLHLLYFQISQAMNWMETTQKKGKERTTETEKREDKKERKNMNNRS